MPSPKMIPRNSDVARVNEIKAGKIEYRLDKTNIIHAPGKVSFGTQKLVENYWPHVGNNPCQTGGRQGQCI